MDKPYYTKHGFNGLNFVGKLAFLGILFGVGTVVYLAWARGDFVRPETEPAGFVESVRSWASGILKIGGIALAAAYGAHFFLPKAKFQKQQFWCAECGRFIGYTAERCPRPECRSNKYTTDGELARQREFRWEKQNKQADS